MTQVKRGNLNNFVTVVSFRTTTKKKQSSLLHWRGTATWHKLHYTETKYPLLVEFTLWSSAFQTNQNHLWSWAGWSTSPSALPFPYHRTITMELFSPLSSNSQWLTHPEIQCCKTHCIVPPYHSAGRCLLKCNLPDDTIEKEFKK